MSQLQFIVTPTNVTVEDGSEVTLPCVATGLQPIAYVWYREENISEPLAIENNSSYRIHFTGNVTGNLTFTEVTSDDEDVYVCTALDVNNPSNVIRSEPFYFTGMLFVCLCQCIQ